MIWIHEGVYNTNKSGLCLKNVFAKYTAWDKSKGKSLLVNTVTFKDPFIRQL